MSEIKVKTSQNFHQFTLLNHCLLNGNNGPDQRVERLKRGSWRGFTKGSTRHFSSPTHDEKSEEIDEKVQRLTMTKKVFFCHVSLIFESMKKNQTQSEQTLLVSRRFELEKGGGKKERIFDVDTIRSEINRGKNNAVSF